MGPPSMQHSSPTIPHRYLHLFSRLALPVLSSVLVLLISGTAVAQIKQPGAHIRYSAELEPQVLVQWDGPGWFDEGPGIGFRASIPMFHNGPIPRINNNMAIGFGFHWAFFEDPCAGYWYNGVRYIGAGDCSAQDFWVPVVLQWNFYLTPSIAVFGEPGIAFRHTRVSVDNCSVNNEPFFDGYDCDYSDTDWLNGVFYAGGKFFVSDGFSVTVRLGYPAVSVGASFYL